MFKPNWDLVWKDVCAFSTSTRRILARDVVIFLVSLAEGTFLSNCQTYIKFKKTKMSCACFSGGFDWYVKIAVKQCREILHTKVHFRLFVFRILDLFYVINSYPHANSWNILSSFFVFCATWKLIQGVWRKYWSRISSGRLKKKPKKTETKGIGTWAQKRCVILRRLEKVKDFYVLWFLGAISFFSGTVWLLI